MVLTPRDFIGMDFLFELPVKMLKSYNTDEFLELCVDVNLDRVEMEFIGGPSNTLTFHSYSDDDPLKIIAEE